MSSEMKHDSANGCEHRGADSIAQVAQAPINSRRIRTPIRLGAGSPSGVFEAMINSVPQLVWRARPDGVIDYLSDQWYAFTGMEKNESRGPGRFDEDWRSAIHAEDSPGFLDSWKQSIGSGERFEAESRIRRVGRGHGWHLCRATRVLDGYGQAIGWYGTGTYVGKQRKERDDLVAASQAKDRFLATLSHELRTPITPALLILAELEADRSLPEHVLERIRVVTRNIQHQAQLVGDLVDVSAGIYGKLSLRREAIDMREVVKEALDVCGPQLEEKNIQVRLTWGVPSSVVIGDRNRLRQVMWNLLRNATKFTASGGSVDIGAVHTAEHLLRVWVKDSGIGIAPDALERLFVPFEQAEASPASRFGGLGLGLAIARNIAELHQGSLFAVSDGPGHGSTFILELPEPPPIAPAPRHAVSPRPKVSKTLLILLVEDHADTASAMERLLKSFGHKVRCAPTAAAALQQAHMDVFDLIISDIHLPDQIGWDFIGVIREFSKAPAIAVSGLGSADDILRCLDAGFDDYLGKPVSVTALRASISAVIS